ncbi:MAG: hypothetical protein FRX48_07274 [Lasallia pustulata]|uniref:Uncharacterized protein n=1 Tax=Lasallia pustulata TaxID=136370 RepID=A0A5M8PJ41_9LECA|nr:MAG: hypothetical protein FRX48_07274 [Lasallia pustulata]
MDGANRISITVCGDGGCGKSSITLRLVRGQWTHEYDPTIEDSYSVTRTIDGTPYHLSLTDTAGQEEYRGLFATSNLSSDAFLLVYDVTSAASLHSLAHFTSMIEMEEEARAERGYRAADGYARRERGVRAVKVVVGNKVDLKARREVSARQGLEWARGRGCGFMETSAREMVNIEETFALVVRRVVEARRVKAEGGAAGQQGRSVAGSLPLRLLGEKGGGWGMWIWRSGRGGRRRRGVFGRG